MWTLRSHFGSGGLAASAVLTLLCACADAAHDEPRPANGAADASSRRGDAGLDAATDAAVDAARDARSDDAFVEVEVGADYMRWPAIVVPASEEISLSFEVPSDAASFVLTLDPGASPRRIELRSVTGPDATELFALDSSPKDGGRSAQAIDPTSQANVDESLPYALMLPSSPDAPFLPGRYQIRVGVTAALAVSDEPLAVDLVWQRSARSGPGRLSLALWFVLGATLDARAAQRDERLQSALSFVREIYADAGIELSQVAYRDLEGDDAQALAALDDAAELAALFHRIAEQGVHDRALDIAFVEHLEVTAGKTVRGKTTGLPVPPTHPLFQRRFGVVIPLDTLPDEPVRIAELIAHEIGHALGLRHTTEYDGERHDPIADTAECPAERATASAASGERLVTVEDCADFDGSNLLFYTPPQDDTAQRDLTAGQRFVLQHNPQVLF